jgi:hypothetical protein
MNEKAIEALNSVVAYAGTYHAKINNDYGIIRLALTELAEIKKRAEEYAIRLEEEKRKPYSMLLLGEDKVIELIDYILKGEKK